MPSKINPQFILRIIGNEAALLDSKTGELLTLNETATVILAGIQSGLNSQEIVEKISNEFEISKAEAKSSVNLFLKELERQYVID